MQDNIDYSSNQAVTSEFYVVSLNKFLVLFLGTAGLYMTYWFYKQWQCYKQAHQGTQWPVMRGIFSVFFVHSLFAKLTQLYQQKSGQQSGALNTAGILFIVVAAISFFSGNVPETTAISPYLVLTSLFTTPLFCWFCYQAQWFANYVCEDINGESNKDYSAANYIWLMVGAALWYLYLVYAVMPLF